VESVVFQPSPLARAGVQAVLLVVAVVIAGRALVVLDQGAGMFVAFLAVVAAVLAPVGLDLWAVVRADREGITWRNRLLRRHLPWSEVAGFERGPTTMVLRRTDDRTVALRALGLRYFGSKRLATERVPVLDRLRTGR